MNVDWPFVFHNFRRNCRLNHCHLPRQKDTAYGSKPLKVKANPASVPMPKGL